MANDYSDLGLNPRLRKLNSLATRPSEYVSALKHDLTVEKNPLMYRTQVLNGRGTIQTNLGAIVDFKNLTGDTSVFTYDPATEAITINGPIITNGTLTIGTAGTFQGPIIFNNQGTINNHSLVFTGGATDGTAAIRMFNSGGTERMTLGIGADGFSYGTLDELRFMSNTSNKFTENFGPVANLADTAGFHGFRVRNANGTDVFAAYANALFEYSGICLSPSAGSSHTARLFLGTTAGGKDELRVIWSSGAVGTLATQP